MGRIGFTMSSTGVPLATLALFMMFLLCNRDIIVVNERARSASGRYTVFMYYILS